MSYGTQATLVAVPASVSVTEALTGGNLVLASVAGLLAVFAGVWAYRKQKTQTETAQLQKLKAELEYQEALNRAIRPPVKPPAKRK